MFRRCSHCPSLHPIPHLFVQANMYFQDNVAADLIIVVNSILCVTSIVSVGIRHQRPSSPQREIDLQNVMLVLAAICGVVTSILQCFATKYGLGLHMTELPPSDIVNLLKVRSIASASDSSNFDSPSTRSIQSSWSPISSATCL